MTLYDKITYSWLILLFFSYILSWFRLMTLETKNEKSKFIDSHWMTLLGLIFIINMINFPLWGMIKIWGY